MPKPEMPKDVKSLRAEAPQQAERPRRQASPFTCLHDRLRLDLKRESGESRAGWYICQDCGERVLAR
jgi:hypothetical protein